MSTKNQGDDKANKISDSSTKTARGSKTVHSEKDDSTRDGFKPKKGRNNEEE